jgi:SMI1 / KNR4 family (SUKH-1)
VFQDNRRLYVRGSPEHLEARSAGLVEKLPPLTPAPDEAVGEAERVVGLSFPRLLRRLHLEVGNGGFGPGYGILGVRGGHRDGDGYTLLDAYRLWHERSGGGGSPLPRGLLPICDWGCGISSFVDCRTDEGGMWACDPNPGIDNDVFPEPLTLATWLERWVDGSLRQPAIIEDPDTGEWRPATEDD